MQHRAAVLKTKKHLQKSIMRKYLTLLAISFSLTLSASHLISGYFTYEHIGTSGNQETYQISLFLYRDVTGISMPAMAGVYYQKSNQSTAVQSINLSQASGTGANGPSLCNSTLGYQVYEYTGTVNLDINSAYKFAWSECCRPGSFNNIVNPSSQGVYINTLVVTGKNAIRPYNNSITVQHAINTTYTNTAMPFEICEADPDGDSLSFQIIAPKGGNAGNLAGTAIAYNTGYSNAAPLGTSGSVIVDSSNRMIVVNSSVQQNAILNIRVIEWSKDTTNTFKIMGVTEREMIFNFVTPPTNYVVSNVQLDTVIANFSADSILIVTTDQVYPTNLNFDSTQLILVDPLGDTNVFINGALPLSSDYKNFKLLLSDSLTPGIWTIYARMNNDSIGIFGNCGTLLVDTMEFLVSPPPPLLVGPSDSLYGQTATYNLLHYEYLDSASFSISNGNILSWSSDYSQFDIEWGPLNSSGEFILVGYSFGNSDTTSISVQIYGIGIEEHPDNLSVFPIPANDYIIVSHSSLNTINFKIYNLLGQVALNGKVFSNQIDVSNLSNGIYVLLLEFNDETRRLKIKIKH